MNASKKEALSLHILANDALCQPSAQCTFALLVLDCNGINSTPFTLNAYCRYRRRVSFVTDVVCILMAELDIWHDFDGDVRARETEGTEASRRDERRPMSISKRCPIFISSSYRERLPSTLSSSAVSCQRYCSPNETVRKAI